jgi:hypothetical protein
MIPQIDNKFEKFDVKKFNEVSVRGYYKLDKGDHVFIQDFQSPGYRELEYIQSSYFKIVVFFYENGGVEKKGLLFNEGSPIGIWYYFDESGKLVKEENTDEGYSFTPENVVRYCEENKIELPKGYKGSGFHTQVKKEDLNGKKVWVIKYLILGGDIQIVILDGQTGKELEKKIVPFVSS